MGWQDIANAIEVESWCKQRSRIGERLLTIHVRIGVDTFRIKIAVPHVCAVALR